MSNRKILIISIVAIIVIIICAILLFVINKYFNTDNYETDFENQILYENTESIELLNNRNKYFVVEKILSSLVSYIKETNGDMEYDTTLIDEQSAKDAFQKEGTQIINQMLDEEYKKAMNSNNINIINLAKKYNDYQSIIDKVYLYDKSAKIDIYIVYAFIGNEEFNIIVKTDSENNTFSIFLEDYFKKFNYNKDMKIEDINISEASIEENDYNKFSYTNITNKQMAQYYLNNYMKLIRANPQLAYSLLEQQYKESKFETFNKFANYTQEKKDMLITLSEYKIINDKDYTMYICKDQYDFVYIFKETALMNYTVQLDDYTIENEELTQEYNELKMVDKGAKNVEKFFEMINMQDYQKAYAKLDTNFKNNNFSTLQKFEDFIKQQIYKYSTINVESYTMIDSDLYTYTVKITNKENSDEQKTQKVIIKLLEGTDFIISFEI